MSKQLENLIIGAADKANGALREAQVLGEAVNAVTPAAVAAATVLVAAVLKNSKSTATRRYRAAQAPALPRTPLLI